MELKIEGQVLGEGGEDGGLVRITGRDGTIDEVSLDEDQRECVVVVCELWSGKVSDVFVVSFDECAWSFVHQVKSGRLEAAIDAPAGRAVVSGPIGVVHTLAYWPPKAEELAHHLEDLVEAMRIEDLFEVYQLALTRVRLADQKAAHEAELAAKLSSAPLPSSIELGLDQPAPFVGCFGRFEAELCAAAYVEACRIRGDRWQPLGAPEVMSSIVTWAESPKPPSWVSFCVASLKLPDVHTLVRGKFFTQVADGEVFRIEPAPLFFETIAVNGYVRAVAA